VTALDDFIAMGGYAGFVWPAFAVAAVVLVVLWLASHRRLRASQGALGALESDRASCKGEA
jgi:heme exporter protein D